MRRRILSLLLAFAMVLGMMPVTAMAEETSAITITAGDQAVSVESFQGVIDGGTNTCYKAEIPTGTAVTIQAGTPEDGVEMVCLNGAYSGKSDDGKFNFAAEDMTSALLTEKETADLGEEFEFAKTGDWAAFVFIDHATSVLSFVFLNLVESETPSETFTVTLTEGGTYTIAATQESKSPVSSGSNFSFTVYPAQGYHMNNAVVKANDTVLTLVDGVYTITNITENQIVTVEGVEQIIENQKTITVPVGAEVHVYYQNGYANGNGNDKEILPVKTVSNGETVTHTYSVKSMGGTYVAFYQDKIPYAGYFNKVTDVSLSWDEETRSPSYRGDYDRSTTFGSRAEDSVYTNVNSNGHLVLNKEFMLRAYRGWQIINSDTANVMIEPEFNYSASNSNITITPYNNREGNDRTVTASGTSSNNWVYLTPNGSGITYLEIGYDAVHIVHGFGSEMDGVAYGQPSNFTWNASDPNRTALLVVQTDGNVASGIEFGIQSPSGGWDYEYDTVYFTESQGSITMKPTGDVATVSVSHNKGGSYRDITGNDGTYVVPIVPGNNIIRITDSNGKTAFQVVRGARISYTITNKTNPDSAVVNVGDEVRIDFHDMHMVCPKISGVYNPGYSTGGGSNRTSYMLNGTTALQSSGYQYNHHSNVWVEFTAPNADCVLTRGTMITSPASGSAIGALYQASNVNSSGTNAIGRNIMPDITIPVEGVTTIPATGVSLDQQSLSLGIDGYTILTATVTPADTTDPIVWTSTDESVATVDNGTVTAHAAGKATITVTVGAYSASCAVEVTEQIAGNFTLETAYKDPDNLLVNTIALGSIQVSGPVPAGEISGKKGPNWSLNIAAGSGDSVTVTMTAALGSGVQGSAKNLYFWANGSKSENTLSYYEGYTYSTTLTPEWTDNQTTLTLGVGKNAPVKNATYTITMTRQAAAAETFDITLPENPVGYTITPAAGSTSPVESGGSYSFTLIVDEEKYQGTPVVKANGTELTAVDGVYTISNITADQEITVEGIREIPKTYTVTFTPDDGTYTIIPVEGTQYPVPSGGDFSFTIEASEGYDVSNVNFVTNLGITPTYANGVYTICNIGQNVIVNVQNVQEAPSGIEIMLPQDDRYTIEIVDGKYQDGDKGSILVEKGETIVFTVTPAEGYKVTVSVNGELLNPENGAYVLEKIEESKEIAVTVAEATPQTYKVTMNSGTGYTISKLADYLSTVNAGGSFGFVAKVNAGYVKGEGFAVTVNGTPIDPQPDGTYLIENIQENQNISVVGVEPCATNSVDVYFSVSKHNDFITKNGRTMALQKLTVPYFDLALYGLSDMYYNPDCYAGGTKESQVGGTPEIANGKVTALHLFIYATEVLYNNLPEAQAGKGWLANEGEWNGYSLYEDHPGSIYGNFWDFGEYNTYFLDYEYPLGRPGHGASADQMLLEDGDVFSVRYKNTNVNPQGTFFHFGPEGDLSQTVKQGDQVTLTLYMTAENYSEGSSTVHNVVTESCNVYVTAGSAPVSHAAQTPVGNTANGQITLDTSDLTPGIYYVTTNTHDPAVMMLIVEEADQPPVQPEEPDVIKGDLNGNEGVDELDVTALYNAIRFETDVDVAVADMNDDGTVDELDVTALYNLVRFS